MKSIITVIIALGLITPVIADDAKTKETNTKVEKQDEKQPKKKASKKPKTREEALSRCREAITALQVDEGVFTYRLARASVERDALEKLTGPHYTRYYRNCMRLTAQEKKARNKKTHKKKCPKKEEEAKS